MKKTNLKEQKDNGTTKLWQRSRSSCFSKHSPVLQIKLAGFFLFMLIAAFFSLSNTLYADALSSHVMEDQPFGERKTLRGSVSASNNEGVALLTQKDEAKGTEQEIWLPFAAGMRLNGYMETKNIAQGDVVVAIYEEDDAQTKRVLRELTFVEKAATAFEAESETVEPETAPETEDAPL